jgi:hypothetical protein
MAMKPFKEQAAEALEALPEEMRQPMVAYIFEQAEKYQLLKREVEKGIASADAGRVREWNFADFLRRAGLSDINAKVE